MKKIYLSFESYFPIGFVSKVLQAAFSYTFSPITVWLCNFFLLQSQTLIGEKL